MSKAIAVIALFLAVIFGAWYTLATLYPQTAPQKSVLYFLDHLIHPHVKLNKHVMGFLPYWRVEDAKYLRLNILSEVNYFGLTLHEDGSIITTINNETDPGWREWNTQEMKDLVTRTHINGSTFSLTIVSQTNTTIESILESKKAQETLIAAILEQAKTRHLDGINIDFEYLGEPDEKYQQLFTDFSQLLSTELHKENIELSISIMPRAARDKDLFDFPRITPLYDKFIGMSYDYYGISSDIAGPVAPMKGFKENKYFFDVTTTYEDYLKVIPKEKILMGVPYYGWDWAVEDGKTIQSMTFPQNDPNSYAAVESYARMRTDKNLKPNQCKWDDYALSTWCWYTDQETKIDHQVWLEDNKSLGIKFDFANKQNLNGIAIWVLGYDKDYPDLWNLIQTNY